MAGRHLIVESLTVFNVSVEFLCKIAQLTRTTSLLKSDKTGAFSLAGVIAVFELGLLLSTVPVVGETGGSLLSPRVSNRRKTLSRRVSTRPSRSLSDARSDSRGNSGSGKSWLRHTVPLAKHSRQLESPSET